MSKKNAWVMKALHELPLAMKAKAMKHFLQGNKKYMKKGIQADMDAIIKCATCPNMCKFDCPVLEAEKNEALSPAGKARIAYFLENGLLDSDYAREIMYACSSCEACKEHCPFDFSVADILRGMRRDMVMEGKVPERVAELKNELLEKHVMGERNFSGDGKGSVIYFAGCVVNNERKEIGEAMIKIFENVGEKYAIMEEEWCCGYPLYNMGFMEEFKEFAIRNARKFNESGAEKIVCSCPTCAHVFTNIYPEMGIRIKPEIVHSSSYILHLIREGKISLEENKMSVVYHDPCTLARKLEVDDARNVIKSIPGIELREAMLHGKETRCCGNGGQMARIHESISIKMAEKRKEDLKEIMADAVVSACPSCKTALMEGKFYDLAELVAESMIK